MAESPEQPAQKTSKHLLYAEKFGGTLLEQKLKIVGKKDIGKPCLPPPSQVLGRVKELLPKLKAANERLKDLPQDEVDLEKIDPDYQGPIIEMNLALVPNEGTSDSEADSSSHEEELDDDDNSDDNNSAGEKDGDSSQEDGAAISQLLLPGQNRQGRSGRKRKLVEEVIGHGETKDTPPPQKMADD